MLVGSLLFGCPAPTAPASCEGPDCTVPTAAVDLCGPVETVFAGQCLACHGEDGAGSLDLREPQGMIDTLAVGAFLPLVPSDGKLEDSYLWHKLQGSVGGGGGMMPRGAALDPEAMQAVRAWVEAGGECTAGELPTRPPLTGAPAPLPLRRLKRFELDNTVRDQLGTTIRPSEQLPADDTLEGFDTLGEALTLSDLHLEQLEWVTEQLAEDFVQRMAPGGPVEIALDPQQMVPSTGRHLQTCWMLWTNGTLAGTFEVPLDGDYQIEVRAWGTQLPPDPVLMTLMKDGPVVTTFDVTRVAPWASHLQTVSLTAGSHDVSVAFFNDATDGINGDRNLIVEGLLVRLQSASSPIHTRYQQGFTCDPTESTRPACLEQLLDPLMTDAFRRPLDDGELQRLVTLLYTLATTHDLPWRDTVIAGVQAVLLSPHFLLEPELGTPGGALTEHELATRLSYFLWSSMPDDELREHADQGDLSDPTVLEAQTRRLLADPKATALVESFGGQWLWLRRIAEGAPDATQHPDVDDALREAFQEQAQVLARQALLRDQPLSTLLTRTTHALDPSLTDFYGFPGTVTSWQDVDLAPEGRVGLPSNGGLLAPLSNPSTTNPARMDPLGFSLERYGPAGEARQTDDLGFAVDTAGVLPDGRSFDGPEGLAQLLANDPLFTLCATEKAFIYGLGARVDVDNHPFVLEAHDRFVQGGGYFEDLVIGVVLTDAFTRRSL